MNTAPVTLVLQKLESVISVARAMSADILAGGDSDARLAQLLTTLNAVERDMQTMQQLRGESSGALPDKPNHYRESPYYWEDY